MEINEFAMVAIPTELLDEAGIEVDGVIQMYVDENRLVLTPIDDEEFDELDHDCHFCFECRRTENSRQNLHGGNCGACCRRCSRYGVYSDGCEKGDAER